MSRPLSPPLYNYKKKKKKSPWSRFNNGVSSLAGRPLGCASGPEEKRLEEWGTGATVRQRKAPQEGSVPTAESICQHRPRGFFLLGAQPGFPRQPGRGAVPCRGSSDSLFKFIDTQILCGTYRDIFFDIRANIYI